MSSGADGYPVGRIASIPWPRRATPRVADGAWPHTDRWLPWLLAGFLVMLWLVPIDAIRLPIPLPVDANPDRFLILFAGLIWVASLAAARSYARPVLRSNPVAPAMLALLAASVLSVLLNLQTLVPLGELELAVKKVAILSTYALLFFIVASTVRPSEVRNFSVLMVVLASITAIGIIYEYRTNFNPFYLLWTVALDALPGVSVAGEGADDEFGRRLISGPTGHAIAAAAILGMAVPFAFTGYLRARTRRHRVLYGIAIGLLLAACISTVRKTGLVAPIGAMIVLTLYRPRAMVRLIPLGVAIILAIQIISPSAISNVKSQFLGGFFEQGSTQGRTTDYPAIVPDIQKYLAFGRGQGTYDPDRYRFIDNEHLKRLLETGVIGLVAYIWVALAVILTGHRARRSRDPVHASIGLSAVASAVVFLVASGTYDQLSFPQAPYLFFFIAGLAVVSASTVKSDSRVRIDPPSENGASHSADGPAGGGPRDAESDPAAAPAPSSYHMARKPDISVVVVTHNRREEALATLRSARAAAEGIAAEWLVVDSGSSDGTPDAIARTWPDVRVIRRDNVGFAAANNAALRHASGRYFLLLNPDVEVVDGTFANLVALMDRRPKVAAASVVQRSPEGKPLPSMGRFPTVTRQLGEALGVARIPGLRSLQELDRRYRRYRRERSADWLVGSFLLLRREAVAHVGGLDERFFLYSEETDWCRRARTAGWDIRHLPIMTVVHHTGRYDRPALAAQLTYSKLLFARKHYRIPRRMGIRTMLAVRHCLRLPVFAAVSLVRRNHSGRVQNELAALSVALGRSVPNVVGPSAATSADVVTAEAVRESLRAELLTRSNGMSERAVGDGNGDGDRSAVTAASRDTGSVVVDSPIDRIETRVDAMLELQRHLMDKIDELERRQSGEGRRSASGPQAGGKDARRRTLRWRR